jgi:hypothetical protein
MYGLVFNDILIIKKYLNINKMWKCVQINTYWICLSKDGFLHRQCNLIKSFQDCTKVTKRTWELKIIDFLTIKNFDY